MCLSVVYSGRKEASELAKLPDMVTCWKVVRKNGNQHGTRYHPEFDYQRHCFLSGWNETIPQIIYRYKIAFHAFLTRDSAEQWKRSYRPLHIIKCKTKKKDIIAIGCQQNLTIVTKRIWIPKPKKQPA